MLDARLPDGSGIDVCRDVRSRHPEVRCLILTSYDDDEALFAAVMAGASGYLLKQIRGTSLSTRSAGRRRAVAARPVGDRQVLERLRTAAEPSRADWPRSPSRSARSSTSSPRG